MAFTFNIGGDDIELDEEDQQISSDVRALRSSQQAVLQPVVKNYLLTDGSSREDATSSFLKSLPSSISYELVEVTQTGIYAAAIPTQSLPSSATPQKNASSSSLVFRRPTYDILLQLKAEADPDTNQHADLIAALEGNDRQSGVYEGGLKTWEGAFDLAALVGEVDFQSKSGDWHVVELGAGSAVPSMTALRVILEQKCSVGLDAESRRFHFTLSDYNDEVLRLSTLANVLLTTNAELDRRETRENSTLLSSEGSVDIDDVLVRNCCELWGQRLSFNFISGPWGKDFDRVVKESTPQGLSNVLILASETIYDMESLPAFTDTVMNLLHKNGPHSVAWIAAKKLYFGVGGGADAFAQEVESRGGVIKEIMNVQHGVGRVVLEVTSRKEYPP